MKTTAIATGLGGIITAAAAAGWPILISLGVLLVIVIGMACWIITNRDRTANAVAIIVAARWQPADADSTADTRHPTPRSASSPTTTDGRSRRRSGRRR